MAYKISNEDFFKKPLMDKKNDDTAPSVRAGEGTGEMSIEKAKPLRIGAAVDSVLTDSGRLLKENGFPELATEINRIRQNANRERFTIGVVGEFNRGKSTFINELLGRSFLPTGNLPTTAVMTRIRCNPREVMLVFDEHYKRIDERELSQDSWEGLVAQNFGGDDFRGEVLVGIHSKWLSDSNIELIDTPGAGDLSESRAKVVGDALLGCDGAIITINATSALSLTEKLFIEERLLARKIPFMLMIVTKLDLVPVEERTGVIQYIKNKLKTWNIEIPVYIPYPVDVKDASFDNIIGMDKIKFEIAKWVTCTERIQTAEKWLLEKTADFLENAISALSEKKMIFKEADKEKRDALISDKNQKLAQAQLVWGELRLQMQKKCTECYELLLSRVDEYADSITERLQYEAAHANSPERWWKEDFPYRVKIELTNMAVGIDNLISRRIGEDAHWYSMAIEKTFHSYIIYQKETISDKELFGDFSVGREMRFDNLDKQRFAFRIGSAVLSISGFALFSAMGFLPIVATMGIGTGTSIASEQFFKKKIKAQMDAMKQEIARSVPIFIQESMAESEERLEAVYDNMINEAEKSEQIWLDAQKNAIEEVRIPGEGKQAAEIAERLTKIQRQRDIIKAM